MDEMKGRALAKVIRETCEKSPLFEAAKGLDPLLILALTSEVARVAEKAYDLGVKDACERAAFESMMA